MQTTSRIVLLTTLTTVLAGCQSAYYGAWEQLGYHKRDILVERVESARDAQTEAKEEFSSALEEFRAVLNHPETELAVKYKKLNDRYESSAERAAAVSDRIDKVESVAEALFDEWEAELDQYTSAELRRSSERQMKDTRRLYEQMLSAMRKAETKIDPVLNAFRDQVLYLKHNLNAQAVASLKQELISVEEDIAELIKEMEASIREADQFIQSMGQSS